MSPSHDVLRWNIRSSVFSQVAVAVDVTKQVVVECCPIDASSMIEATDSTELDGAVLTVEQLFRSKAAVTLGTARSVMGTCAPLAEEAPTRQARDCTQISAPYAAPQVAPQQRLRCPDLQHGGSRIPFSCEALPLAERVSSHGWMSTTAIKDSMRAVSEKNFATYRVYTTATRMLLSPHDKIRANGCHLR